MRLKVLTLANPTCRYDWQYDLAQLDEVVVSKIPASLKTSATKYLAAKRRAEQAYAEDRSHAEQATARAVLSAVREELRERLSQTTKRDAALVLLRAHLAHERLIAESSDVEAMREAVQARGLLESARAQLPAELAPRAEGLALALDSLTGVAGDAEVFLDRVSELSSSQDELGASASLGKALKLTELGRTHEALAEYGRWLERDATPSDARRCVLTNRANLATRLGAYDVVLTTATELLELRGVSPRGGDAERWAASAIAHLGGIDRVALQTSNPETAAAILRHAGWRSAQLGDLSAAARAWRAALDAAGESALAPLLVRELSELGERMPGDSATKPALRSLLQTCFEQTSFGDASIPVRISYRPAAPPMISVDEERVAESECLKKLAPSELSTLNEPFDVRIDVTWGYPGGWD